MPTSFPGMDPYLERQGLWKEVHTNLISSIQRYLTPVLRPRYRVAIEHRTYLSLLPSDESLTGQPDILVVSPSHNQGSHTIAMAAPVAEPLVGTLPMPEEVLERYLEIRDLSTQEVITVIEILSPTNKSTSDGRSQYRRKRRKVLSSFTHLVEIDLLRGGKPFAMRVPKQSDYRIVVSRSHHRPRADFYLFDLPQPIPDFPIPLRSGDIEPTLPLNQLLHTVYDEGGFDLAINYARPPKPAIAKKYRAWATELLKHHGE